MNINKTIKFLLGKSSTQDTNDCVPSYLSSEYDREGAAFHLGELGVNSPQILGALCKACLQDAEEDVRLTSLEALEKIDHKFAIAMAYCMVDDEYENIQEHALSIIDSFTN
ncbi:MAG: HEAT repeat domain-containing protein [Arenicella sp.]